MNQIRKNTTGQSRSRAGSIDKGPKTRSQAGESGAEGVRNRFVVFMLGNKYLAVEAGSVAEVVRDLRVTPLPNLPAWLVGIANLRSEIATLIDLAKLLGDGTGRSTPSLKHVVLRSERFDALIAFKVDKLREMTEISEAELNEPEDDQPGFISGVTEYRSSKLAVIDARALFTSLSLD